VDPEIAFVPAEEASADDPVYGRFARAEPGGEGYYAAAAAEGQAESDADAADPDALRVVAQTANDDAADPVDPMDDAVRVKYVVDMRTPRSPSRGRARTTPPRRCASGGRRRTRRAEPSGGCGARESASAGEAPRCRWPPSRASSCGSPPSS
jgi:hypothetical protein